MPPPADFDSDSSGKNSECENRSAENIAWIKAAVNQLLSPKGFLVNATKTVDVLVSMLNRVTNGHDLSCSTRSISTMTVQDAGTTVDQF